MKQEELLLIDLCGRSYYKVKVSAIYDDDEEYEGTLCAIYPEDNRIIIDNLNKPCHYPNQTCGGFIIDEHKVKPYLFPLSSMTEEQREEFLNIQTEERQILLNALIEYKSGKYDKIPIIAPYKQIEWLNKNHFDYRGLIPMGLAIDASNLNIY